MKTAAIYARFSTDLQSERSIDDQLKLCRAFAYREGLRVIATFDDKARSGGSTHGRDGLAALLESANSGAFAVLVVEALDRLSRDMEDLAHLYKRLTHLGIEIRAVHEGKVNTLLVGLRGLIGQMYREDNVHKIRRGQSGRAREGLTPGGIAYGYAPVEGRLGERRIVEAEADAVRRIFAAFLSGDTPRDIAASLNRDGIPSPRGGLWNASTINGNGARGGGILRNETYAGVLTWNRAHMVRDPDTGRRLWRGNPESEWISAEVPALAIISRETFAAAAARLAQRSTSHPTNHRRPKRLLSGLLRCGACGAGMSSHGADRWGRTRVQCSGHAERQSCPDPSSFYLDAIERGVVAALREEMRDPRIIAEYVRAYAEERARLAAGATAARDAIEKRLRAIDVESERIIDWMLQGTGNIERLSARAKELQLEESTLKVQLAGLSAPPPKVVRLHPGLLAKFEAQLATLDVVLGRPIARGETEASSAIRDLVETVTVRRDTHGHVDIEIAGRLTELLGDEAFPNGIRRKVGGIDGSGGVTHMLPPTLFRLRARAA